MKKTKDTDEKTPEQVASELYEAAAKSVSPEWAAAVAAVAAPFAANPAPELREQIQRLRKEWFDALNGKPAKTKAGSRSVCDIEADLESVLAEISYLAYSRASKFLDFIRVEIYKSMQMHAEAAAQTSEAEKHSIEDVIQNSKGSIKTQRAVRERLFNRLGYPVTKRAASAPWVGAWYGVKSREDVEEIWNRASLLKGTVGEFDNELFELLTRKYVKIKKSTDAK